VTEDAARIASICIPALAGTTTSISPPCLFRLADFQKLLIAQGIELEWPRLRPL